MARLDSARELGDGDHGDVEFAGEDLQPAADRADLLDAAFLGGTAAHGIELDVGYTKGSVHPGCTVVPAILSAGYVKKASGAQLIEAMVAGRRSAVPGLLNKVTSTSGRFVPRTILLPLVRRAYRSRGGAK